MGSTYVTGKSAAACMDEDGRVFYRLAERSHESNVFPQCPQWGAVFFGTYEQCMDYVIRAASAVEGGCLKGDARTPTAWIKQWRDQLAHPIQLEKGVLEANFGEGIYELPQGHRERVIAQFESFDLSPITGIRLLLDLNAHGALQALSQLFAQRLEGIHAWRFWRYASSYGVPCVDLGRPAAVQGKIALDVQVFKLPVPSLCDSEFDHAIVTPTGTRMTGWAYSTMQAFISEDAAALERNFPGSAETAIRAFRKQVESAPVLPAQARLRVKRPSQEYSYVVGRFNALCAGLGLEEAGEVNFAIGDLTAELQQIVHNLANSRLVEFELQTSQKQLDLLAA